ncbi:MAG: hypothetical protein KJ630_21125 [Proteobacteria bacterium]|nr:hypothetical protein [Pseudomonadota bacterium]
MDLAVITKREKSVAMYGFVRALKIIGETVVNGQNAKGYKMSWNGYTLHLNTNDIGFPPQQKSIP